MFTHFPYFAQGTVTAALFLFSLYTSDFTYDSESCHVQKYSDETAIVACVREECNGYATDVVLLRQGLRSLPWGVEPATSDLPSATTTNYAKEQLAIN